SRRGVRCWSAGRGRGESSCQPDPEDGREADHQQYGGATSLGRGGNAVGMFLAKPVGEGLDEVLRLLESHSRGFAIELDGFDFPAGEDGGGDLVLSGVSQFHRAPERSKG